MKELETYILGHGDSLHDFDLWILHVLNDLVYEVNKYFDKFALGEAAHRATQSVWQYFCDWYIEIAKISPSPLTPLVLRYVL